MKLLHDLLHVLPGNEPQKTELVEILGIASDSRKVQPGSLFVAIPGLTVDGHRFISDAVERGAKAIVGERDRRSLDLPDEFPYIQVDDSRLALAWLVAGFLDHPARRMRMIGVTGTDGKTTVVNLIYSILMAANVHAGMISTVNARIGPKGYETGLHTTTPDALETQHYLKEMAEHGTEIAILEATSHGLAQHRVGACEFDIAVVTNITHEHLDYHCSYAAYRQAKSMLFWDLSHAVRKPGIPKVSILNMDDASFPYLNSIPADIVLTYGLDAGADLSVESIICTDDETRFVARTPEGQIPIRSHLTGDFNVYNILAAIATACSMGIPLEQIQAGVESLHGIIGRMEQIDMGQPFAVIIDFAHTPNALRSALSAARRLTDGRITVVFGCAGLRDVQKRPLMGQVAAELADRIILTAEDPRTEGVREINAQIVEGYRRSGRSIDRTLVEIDDRAQAIQRAVDDADPGDLVLIAGKGHERSLCFGTEETPWSDHKAVAEALHNRTTRRNQW